MNALEHARNTANNGRMRFAHGIGNCCNIINVINRVSVILIHVIDNTFKHVTEREKAYGDQFRILLRDCINGFHIAEQVSVRQHYSFGNTCCTACVNNRCHIVFGNAFFDCIQLFRIRILASECIELIQMFDSVQVTESVKPFDVFALRKNVFDAQIHFFACNKNHPCFGMIENMFVFVGTDIRIYGHMNSSGHHDCHVEKIPFRPVGGDGNNLVAWFNA
ncbi:hypothetical protein SDC9_89150 [bioreactor metagenome]|uniref:Uncharacterized protein n=1 Tax=bioreactor metagenome TaxID=1076179 RepID=A0A644ZNK7_9ZZZZ